MPVRTSVGRLRVPLAGIAVIWACGRGGVEGGREGRGKMRNALVARGVWARAAPRVSSCAARWRAGFWSPPGAWYGRLTSGLVRWCERTPWRHRVTAVRRYICRRRVQAEARGGVA